MKLSKVEVPFGAQNLIIETGKFAKQAHGSVTVTLGGTMVLVTACMSSNPRENIDFFPLMVEYQEKTYSAGRIPGGFFKREGRPSRKETLTARMIDRPIRPLFPEGFYYDVQVTATVLSSDGENDPDMLAIIGASAALNISKIPFEGPIGAVRVNLIEDKFVVNPTYEQRELSTMELIVVGLKDGIVMIEGEAGQVPEEKVLEGLKLADEQLQPIREIQNKFQKEIGVEKAEVTLFQTHPDLKKKVEGLLAGGLSKAYKIADKEKREESLKSLMSDLTSDLSVFDDYKMDEREVTDNDIRIMFDQIEYDVIRKMIFEEQKRADGRAPKEIRALASEVNVLPRTHGSSLFTRGQTQSLAVVTLGTKRDEQLIESLDGVNYENFMLHYNFPSFSVGETRPMRGPGRREIGHGALAAKALKAVLPSKDDFPYTVRIVSEILESNGSSSMASVCAGCLSLMASGVPISAAVAGISIGVVSEGEKFCLLTDIMGLEDHFGDMDFKVAGSHKGITAIQLDIKINGIPLKVLSDALQQAKGAREEILKNMESVIDKPVEEISEFAPRIVTTQVPQEKIGEVIGPGGKVVKKIIEMTGIESLDIEEDGKVLISSMNGASAQAAIDYVNGLVAEPIVGKTYNAVVAKVTNFGAFCEFMPGKQGLVHVSEFSDEYIKDLTGVVKVGEEFKVKLVEIDKMKRMNLSKKQAEA